MIAEFGALIKNTAFAAWLAMDLQDSDSESDLAVSPSGSSIQGKKAINRGRWTKEEVRFSIFPQPRRSLFVIVCKSESLPLDFDAGRKAKEVG